MGVGSDGEGMFQKDKHWDWGGGGGGLLIMETFSRLILFLQVCCLTYLKKTDFHAKF